MNLIARILALCFLVGLVVIVFRVICVGAATLWQFLPAILLGYGVYWLLAKRR